METVVLKDNERLTELKSLDKVFDLLVKKRKTDNSNRSHYISEYEKFLLFKKNFPQIKLSPSKEIDAMWHQHILWTKQYMLDCAFLFGEFLHHTPNFGKTQTNNIENLSKKWNELFDSPLPLGIQECD